MKNGKIIIFLLAMLMMTVLSLSSCQLLDSFIESPPESPTEHILSKVDAVAATCTVDGHEEYYTCSGCELIFADAEGTIILEAPEVIPCLGHTPKIILGVPATCTSDGYTASRVCTVCNEIVTPAKELPASHKASPTATLTGFTLENIDGKAYMVIYGKDVANLTCSECGENAPLKLGADFQHNNNVDGLGWETVKVFADKNNYGSNVSDKTNVNPAVSATIFDDGSFEARFDVTDIENGTFTIHAGLDGKLGDCKNHGNGDGVAVYADGKKFSFLKDKDTTWNTISLVVGDATESAYNLNGRMSLESDGEKAYVVFNGAWNTKNGNAGAVKAALEAEYYSIQQFHNGWATTVCTPVVEVNEDGTLKVKLSLEGFAVTGTANPFYMHQGITQASQKDVKIHVDQSNSKVTVGGYTYQIVKGCDLDTTWTTTLTVIYITENAE